jgi:hypothetical protein
LNVILGGNDTGKSIIIKSIFEVLGAEVELDSRWKKSASAIILDFKVEEDNYTIIKWGKSYGLLEGDDFTVYKSVSKELGPKLASIFKFGMVWNNDQGEEIIPPPAYYLLPFYLDQDKSWTNNWSSFNRLYLKGIRKDLVDYHVGIKPNEYYTAKVRQNKVKLEVKDVEKDLATLKMLLNDAEESIGKRIDVSLSKEEFKEEIDRLVFVTESLYHEQVKVRSQIQKYYSTRILINEQINIVAKSLNEFKEDLEFAAKELKDEIECPTCGAVYQNSFQERFAIAEDEYKCYELLLELNEELEVINRKISDRQKLINGVNAEIIKVEERLNEAKKNVKLSDVIEAEGEKQMRAMFSDKIAKTEERLKDLMLEMAELKIEIDRFTNKDRKAEIVEKYRFNMARNLYELNLQPDEGQFRAIDTKISGLGSARPRAALSYFFSIQALSKEYSTYNRFPIVIDEPEQQGQDDINMPAILKFLNKMSNISHQTILGLQNTDGMEVLEENIISKTTTKYSVMNEEDFTAAEKIATPLIEKILAEREDELF